MALCLASGCATVDKAQYADAIATCADPWASFPPGPWNEPFGDQ